MVLSSQIENQLVKMTSFKELRAELKASGKPDGYKAIPEITYAQLFPNDDQDYKTRLANGTLTQEMKEKIKATQSAKRRADNQIQKEWAEKNPDLHAKWREYKTRHKKTRDSDETENPPKKRKKKSRSAASNEEDDEGDDEASMIDILESKLNKTKEALTKYKNLYFDKCDQLNQKSDEMTKLATDHVDLHHNLLELVRDIKQSRLFVSEMSDLLGSIKSLKKYESTASGVRATTSQSSEMEQMTGILSTMQKELHDLKTDHQEERINLHFEIDEKDRINEDMKTVSKKHVDSLMKLLEGVNQDSNKDTIITTLQECRTMVETFGNNIDRISNFSKLQTTTTTTTTTPQHHSVPMGKSAARLLMKLKEDEEKGDQDDQNKEDNLFEGFSDEDGE